MRARLSHALYATAFVCVGISPVLAEDMPRSGDYKVIYTGVNMAPIKPIPIGGGRMLAVSHFTMTAVNAAGSGFLNNLPGRCVGMATLDNDAKTVESHGRCVYADAGGDQIFETYDYAVQPQGPNIRGKGEWTGGTGKFAGISGDVELTNTRLSAMTDGIAQVSGTKTGRYSFESTTSSLK
ncbi:hypothetical protein [Methylobacterium sp. J-070]|uniref:hypothetical protein n=1 Tax=Methylobacterium sp. J-070 TaxID=2836650 RepID=UPI001FB98A70|nr:hypothetical protein [Methylobacterium sp. J-070]MCJ2052344.1 hypothetical protein [Methylobacterium sp. J-070]